MKWKYLFVVLLVFLNVGSYVYEGYFSEASLLFNVFYVATLLVSVYVLCRLEFKPLFVFSVLAVALGICVEYVNTEAGNWAYFTGAQPPLFVAVGWVFLLALVFYGAGLLKKYVKWEHHAVIPVLVCFGLFLIFSYAEGSISSLTLVLFVFMAFLGVYSSFSRSFSWSVAVLVMGIVIGSASEALGASCGLWSFRSGVILPLSMVLAWSANAFCVSGLLKITGFPAEELF